MQYTSLDSVPLPKTIYNGSLDKKIVPLVKAVISHGLTTIGSCEGHIDRGDQYPWVQFMPYDDSRFVGFLVDKYNGRNNVHWRMDGNSLRTRREARSLSGLYKLQDDIEGFSQFLFQYRPEVIDPDYTGAIRIPDLDDPEYIRVSSSIDRLYEELMEMNESRRGKRPADENVNRKMIEKVNKLEELHEREAQIGDVLMMSITEEKMKEWMKKAEKIIS